MVDKLVASVTWNMALCMIVGCGSKRGRDKGLYFARFTSYQVKRDISTDPGFHSRRYHVGRVCCWFNSLLREVLKANTSKIPIRSGNHSSRCSARVLAFSLCYTKQLLLQLCYNTCDTGRRLLQLASLRRSKNSADDWYQSAHALKGGVASTVLPCATTKKFVVALNEWELISTSCIADDCGNEKWEEFLWEGVLHWANCNFSSNLCRNKWRGKVLETLSSATEAWPEFMVYHSALWGFSSAIPVFSSNQRHLIVLIVLV